MSKMFAGIDLGGTNIKGAMGDSSGHLVAETSVPTKSHEGPNGVLKRIGDLVEMLAGEAGQHPTAVGLGVPGLVDLPTGTTKFLPNFPTKWRDVEAGRILSERLKCPVYLLNDVRTITLGELTFGHGKTFPKETTLVYFALGTGVGGGIVIDGKLRLGPLGAAGELGHQTIIPDGHLCGCGNRGCLETLCSGPAIAGEGVRLLKSGLAPHLYEIVDGDPDLVTVKEMAQAARAGDEAVMDIILRAADYLAIGVANMMTALHPDLVVIGGGVANLADLLMDPLRVAVAKRVRMFPPESVRIELSALSGLAGVLGGVALAMKGGKLIDQVG